MNESPVDILTRALEMRRLYWVIGPDTAVNETLSRIGCAYSWPDSTWFVELVSFFQATEIIKLGHKLKLVERDHEKFLRKVQKRNETYCN